MFTLRKSASDLWAWAVGGLLLAGVGPALADGFALADFRSLEVLMWDDGGAEHLDPLWGTVEKEAAAESARDKKPLKKFQPLPASDKRVAHAVGPHTQAHAGETKLNFSSLFVPGWLTFDRHEARAQGDRGFAYAMTSASIFFRIIGDPGVNDKVSLQLRLDNAAVVEQGDADAVLGVSVGGTLAGKGKSYWFDKPTTKFPMDPLEIPLGQFAEGEVVRLEIKPEVWATVFPEPSVFALLVPALLMVRRRAI